MSAGPRVTVPDCASVRRSERYESERDAFGTTTGADAPVCVPAPPDGEGGGEEAAPGELPESAWIRARPIITAATTTPTTVHRSLRSRRTAPPRPSCRVSATYHPPRR